MTSATDSRFVYVTFIKTTPDRLWSALTEPDFIRQYWFGMAVESDWKAGASWCLRYQDGRVADDGVIEAFEPPKHLAIRWQNRWKPEFEAEGSALCTMQIEPLEGAVKLTVTHTIAHPESKFIGAVSNGWPRILSNLKSLLETGAVVLP